jgi:hypothetical protein
VIAYRQGNVKGGKSADHYIVKQGQSWSELYSLGNDTPRKLNTEDVLAEKWVDSSYYKDGGEFEGETLYFILKEDWYK